MDKKKWVLLIVIVVLVVAGLLLANHDSIGESIAISHINKAFEKSFEFNSASMETTILKGSYYPKDAPQKINIDFTREEDSKDKHKRNVDFSVVYTYEDRTEKVENTTNYEGIFLNNYYPYTKFNNIRPETVESIEVNEVEGGVEYYVYYNKMHLSRRMEWEYCKVSKDYEYFFVNNDGVVAKYTSDTYFKQQKTENSEWVDGESKFSVELLDYTMF